MKPLISTYSKNIVMQKAGENKQLISVDEVVDSWKGAVDLAQQEDMGLRTPQIGALFAIKAHWTVSREPATVVMLHSAAANGRWCGDQRPPCGLKTAG